MNKIIEIVISENVNPEGYIIQIFVDDADGKEVIILKIDQNYYFPEYFGDQPFYFYVIPKGHPHININANIPISAISYDFNHEKITQAVRGFVMMSATNIYQKLDLLPTTENDSSVWINGLLVEKVEGPYQEGKLVDVIDLKQPVYYLATPNNQNIHSSQFLSIKWEYQYNQEETSAFKNCKRSVIEENGVNKCKLECNFHNNQTIEEITVYAYYRVKSSKAAVISKTSNSLVSNAASDDLIWSAKFTTVELVKVIEISNRLKFNPNYLMAAMALETGGTFNPALVNSLGYTGLIQIGHDAAQTINNRKGTNITAGKNGNLKKMTRLEQLTYVEYYLEPFKGKLNTLADFYLAIIFPVDCGKGNNPNYVVFDKYIKLEYYSNGNVKKNTKYYRQKGYAANPAFHLEKAEKGKTYVWEISSIIEKWYKRGELNKGNSKETDNSENNPEGWHEPVDNPRSTIYMQSGGGGENGKHWGLFGKTRSGKNHTGLDLFANSGTKIYSCVDGTIYNRRWHNGYGNTVTVKVNDVEAFLKFKRNYQLQYEKNGEILKGKDWIETKNIYLFYAHLDSVNEYKFGDPVKCGEILGTTGRSGVTAGTCAPHLHFEIFCEYVTAVGTQYRVNPALFVNYKGYNDQSEDERNEQTKTKNQGQIIEVSGKVQLEYANMPGFKK